MPSMVHIIETTLLLLAAYLLGCTLGYAARRVVHAGRGTRQVTAVAAEAVAVPVEAKRPAARLAASVEELPPAPVPVKKAPAKPEPVRPAAAKPVVAKPVAVELAKPVEEAKPASKPAPRVVASKPAAVPKAKGPKPATLSAPRAGGADNLKQIKGIGPKIEASLQAMGIYHIDQIASWNKANVDWVDAQLAFKGRIRRERWVEQAIELSKTRASA